MGRFKIIYRNTFHVLTKTNIKEILDSIKFKCRCGINKVIQVIIKISQSLFTIKLRDNRTQSKYILFLNFEVMFMK